MKGVKIKETYLLFLIVIGLASLALYSTYALFVASVETDDVVAFDTSLTTGSSLLEYEMITVPAGENKIVEINLTNSHNETLYYGAWYEMIQPRNDDSNMQVGIYTDVDSTPGTGTISSGETLSLVVGITNNGSSEVIVNVGTVGSSTSNLNLSDNRKTITGEWTNTIIVTDEYLEQHTVINSEIISSQEYTTPEVTELTLEPGTYKLEAWGAKAWSEMSSPGYSTGIINLSNSTKVYITPGGKGNTDGTGGFNGGNGDAGGASDVRIGTNSLYSRVIVAGGCGASSLMLMTTDTSGGGLKGEDDTTGFSNVISATGGTQTRGGTGAIGEVDGASYNGENGTFGTGGIGYDGGGYGGGGWYGGGGGFYYTDIIDMIITAGAGGSGWVYTEESFNNWMSDNPSDASNWLLNPSYYLTDASTVMGGTYSYPYSGNGVVKISKVNNTYGYTIPRVLGLTDLTISYGSNFDLTEGVTHECALGESCTYSGVNINSTSTLNPGTHTIYYIVEGANGIKYKYPRTVTVVVQPVSYTVLQNLNLTSLLNEGEPDFTTNPTTDEGIYAMEDDLGTSYYFRGASERNYVKFAGYYWRIIRINGDGTIRMIYDGTTAHENGEASDDRINTTSSFNKNKNDNTYVGYMYGTAGVTVTGENGYKQTHSNKYDSAVKTYLEDTWYATNIKNTAYEQYVRDAIYCNDRSLDTSDASYTGIGKTLTYYAAYQRLTKLTIPEPTLNCKNQNDRFTYNESVGEVLGNNKLEAPIGLITADELFLGGIRGKKSYNRASYLYVGNGRPFWTMSPSHFDEQYAYVIRTRYSLDDEYLADNGVSVAYSVRAVISISVDALKYGDGRINNPFRLTSEI